MSKYTGATGSMIAHRYGSVGAPMTSQVADTVVNEMSFGADRRLSDKRGLETRTADTRKFGHDSGRRRSAQHFGMYDLLSDKVSTDMFGEPEDHFGGIQRQDLFGLDYIAYDPEDELDEIDLFSEEDESGYGLDYIAYDPEDELDEIDLFDDDEAETMGYYPYDEYGIARADLFGALNPTDSAHRYAASKAGATLLRLGFPPFPQTGAGAIEGGLAQQKDSGTSIVEIPAEDENGNQLPFPEKLIPQLQYYTAAAQRATHDPSTPKLMIKRNVSSHGGLSHQIWYIS